MSGWIKCSFLLLILAITTGSIRAETVTCGGVGDGVTDDSATLMNCATGSQNKMLKISQVYRISSDIRISIPVRFEGVGALRPDKGHTIVIEGPVDAPDDRQIFYGEGQVTLSSASRVSVAWWGALAAAESGQDAMPSIQAAFGPNRKIFFPAGNYICKSFRARLYPMVAGPQCLTFANADNWTIEGVGATVTADDQHNNSMLMAIDNASNVTVKGLRFLANPTGLPAGSEPVAVFAVHMTGFSFEDLDFAGNWGGSSRQPFAFAGDWLRDGVFTRLTMSAVGGCFDLAFLERVSFSHIRAVGADDAGTKNVSSRTPCMNIEDDVTFRTRYPEAASFTKTKEVILGPDLDFSNFVEAIFLRAGSGYRIENDRLHDNPGSRTPITKGEGAAIILRYEEAGCCSSKDDPVAGVSITGNTIENNGALQKGAGIIFDSRGSDQGVVNDVKIRNNRFIGNNSAHVMSFTRGGAKNVIMCLNYFKNSEEKNDETIPKDMTITSEITLNVQYENCPER